MSNLILTCTRCPNSSPFTDLNEAEDHVKTHHPDVDPLNMSSVLRIGHHSSNQSSTGQSTSNTSSYPHLSQTTDPSSASTGSNAFGRCSQSAQNSGLQGAEGPYFTSPPSTTYDAYGNQPQSAVNRGTHMHLRSVST